MEDKTLQISTNWIAAGTHVDYNKDEEKKKLRIVIPPKLMPPCLVRQQAHDWDYEDKCGENI